MSSDRRRGVDLSPGSGFSVSWYVSYWLDAVERQAKRLAEHAAPNQQLDRYGHQVDAAFFIFALDGLRRTAEWAEAKMITADLRGPLESFEVAVPGTKRCRNALTHFDEWRSGLGVGQPLDWDESGWIFVPFFAARDGEVTIGLRLGADEVYDFDVDASVAAARTLAGACQTTIDAYVDSFRGRDADTNPGTQ